MMTPFSQYCIWLNSENTVRIVIKRLKERIALSQVLLTDVVRKKYPNLFEYFHFET